jgi:hypothetical protein
MTDTDLAFRMQLLSIYRFGILLTSLKQKLETSLFGMGPGDENELSYLSDLSVLKNVELFKDIGDSIVGWSNYLSQTPLSREVRKRLLSEVIRWERDFETILDRGKLGIVHLQCETLNLDNLRKGLEPFFPEAEIQWLTDLERESLDDARLCILIGAPTPAEFMCVRCFESILRRWYEWKTKKVIEKNGVKKILDGLIEAYGKEYPAQLHLSKYLKETRDKLAHPDKISLQIEAESTFNIMVRFVRECQKVMQ